MLVFVDDSGDTGFKLGQGSSGEFTLTLVVFPDHADAEAASKRIDTLRAEMGLPQGKGEFHFNESSNTQRRRFLEAVSGYPFQVFAVVQEATGGLAQAEDE